MVGSKAKNANKRLILVLFGGKGNQLFQIAFGVIAAKYFGLRVEVDTKFGFWFDKAFGRRLALKSDTLVDYKLSLTGRLIVCWFVIKTKVFNFNCARAVRDYDDLYKFAFDGTRRGAAVGWGYYQDGHEIEKHRNIVVSDILNIEFKNFLSQRVSSGKHDVELIKVGLRLYEEVQDTTARMSHLGGLDLDQFERELVRLIASYPRCRCHIFTTDSAAIGDHFRNDSRFSVFDQSSGIRTADQVIESLASCDILVITNSSLYWWAGFYSFYVAAQPVLITRNFSMVNACIDGWKYIDEF